MCIGGVMIIRKFEALIFNIKKEGARHLRGKIAELVFEQVYPKLFKSLREHIVICSTSSIKQFLYKVELRNEELLYEGVNLEFKLKSLKDLLKDEEKLKREKERLEGEMKRLDEEVMVFRRELKIALWEYMSQGCVLCGRPRPWSIGEKSLELCNDYYETAWDKLKWKDFKKLKDIAKKIVDIREKLRKVRDKLREISIARLDVEVLEVISRLSIEDVLFLQEVYCGYLTGPPPFDYIGVTLDGSEKYLIDVTSTRSGSMAGLSLKERKVAELAKKHGFKILVPVIYFGDNWNVIIKIEEL